IVYDLVEMCFFLQVFAMFFSRDNSKIRFASALKCLSTKCSTQPRTWIHLEKIAQAQDLITKQLPKSAGIQVSSQWRDKLTTGDKVRLLCPKKLNSRQKKCLPGKSKIGKSGSNESLSQVSRKAK